MKPLGQVFCNLKSLVCDLAVYQNGFNAILSLYIFIRFLKELFGTADICSESRS